MLKEQGKMAGTLLLWRLRMGNAEFHRGVLRCKDSRFETECPCKTITINKVEVDVEVLQSVKKEVVLFLEEEKLARQKKADASLTVAEQIKDIMASLEKLWQGWMGVYDRYADREMNREIFIT